MSNFFLLLKSNVNVQENISDISPSENVKGEVAIVENLKEPEKSEDVVKENSEVQSTSQQIIESQSELSLESSTNEVVNDEDKTEVIEEKLVNVDAPDEIVVKKGVESTQFQEEFRNSSVDTSIPLSEPSPSLSNISCNSPNDDSIDEKKPETVEVRLIKQ